MKDFEESQRFKPMKRSYRDKEKKPTCKRENDDQVSVHT